MIKILDSKKKNFDIILDRLLSERKDKIELSSVSVTKIIKDVKKSLIYLKEKVFQHTFFVFFYRKCCTCVCL